MVGVVLNLSGVRAVRPLARVPNKGFARRPQTPWLGGVRVGVGVEGMWTWECSRGDSWEWEFRVWGECGARHVAPKGVTAGWSISSFHKKEVLLNRISFPQISLKICKNEALDHS